MNDEMMISGQWFNKNTGDVVTVVNNVIDGDEMIVITDKGPIKLQDFSEYMQVSDEVYDANGRIVGKEQVDYKAMVQEKPQTSVAEVKKPVQQKTPPVNNLEFDDSNFTSVPEPAEFKATKPKQQVSNNDHIIGKFFDKIKDKDKLISIELNTDILPTNDLKTIIEYMDVSVKEIATYITEQIIL